MGFFDKLKEQASSLGAQLDQALDSTKQKAQISSLRKQRTELVTQLGEALLSQFRENRPNPDALRPQVDQIFNLEWQIIELEKQVEAQRQAAQQAQVAGTPAAAAQPAPPPPPPPPTAAAPAPPQAAPQPGTAACPSCGAEVPAGSVFCPNCGTRIGG
ncbi:zinc ribbon domain-containing protein [Candidatus Solincola tengchongensis]|uniref:zinc ribbon domain-containing protein n=1 Tax=Candidatus Solincola tengchongensis TaxID=2900693 RepID=UPI00257A4975|nr:zinc ribbon domain-containing protein [Candidatus Solincola tengchongensis]